MTEGTRADVIQQIAGSRGTLLDVIQLAGGFARQQAERQGPQAAAARPGAQRATPGERSL